MLPSRRSQRLYVVDAQDFEAETEEQDPNQRTEPSNQDLDKESGGSHVTLRKRRIYRARKTHDWVFGLSLLAAKPKDLDAAPNYHLPRPPRTTEARICVDTDNWG